MVFLFAACNNNDTPSQTESSTNSSEIITTQKNDSSETETTDDTTNATSNNNKVTLVSAIVGEWTCTETFTPQTFYGEHYNANITKTNIVLKTTYKFNNNGTFSTGISIENINEVRKEYRSLIVEGARKNIEAQGKYLTTDDVLKYEAFADSTLNEICAVQKGNYEIQKDMIIYKVSDKSHYESFVLSGDKLTLTASSTQSEGYPITLTRV